MACKFYLRVLKIFLFGLSVCVFLTAVQARLADPRARGDSSGFVFHLQQGYAGLGVTWDSEAPNHTLSLLSYLFDPVLYL